MLVHTNMNEIKREAFALTKYACTAASKAFDFMR